MARPFRLLIAGTALVGATLLSPVGAAPEATGGGARMKGSGAPGGAQKGSGLQGGAHLGERAPGTDNVRRALEGLTPEQRKRFGENLMRWSDLSTAEKKALREREEVRKKYMEKEIEFALAESGLRLEGERRAQFVKRFGEERQKIEEQLRHEMVEKRKPLVRELIGRLKAEFLTSK